MPENESGGDSQKPTPPQPAPQTQKIEIIPLQPKKIIKKNEDPRRLEKRKGDPPAKKSD